MYIRFYMIRNHVNSNVDRLYIIYIRFSIVTCHIISNMVLSRISHIRYYIASDHRKSNIYRSGLAAKTRFQDLFFFETYYKGQLCFVLFLRGYPFFFGRTQIMLEALSQ